MYQDICSCANNKNKRLKGYTILEMVIATLFFAITVVCLSLPFCESINLSAKDQDIVNANSLAKTYLKAIELKWQFQTNYDAGDLPEITNVETFNDKYSVTAVKQDIAQNSDSIVIVRRVNVKYTDKNNNILVDLFTDFNRPESAIK